MTRNEQQVQHITEWLQTNDPKLLEEAKQFVEDNPKLRYDLVDAVDYLDPTTYNEYCEDE